MTDHARYRDDAGPYLLGALNELERQAFERHLAGCDECQETVELLRPAANALPGSVEQLEPPPGLKARLMAEVGGDRSRRRLRAPRLSGVPRLAFATAAVLLLGLVVGLGIARLGGDDTRTLTATVAKAMPRAGGQLEIRGERATLRLHDMPDLGRDAGVRGLAPARRAAGPGSHLRGGRERGRQRRAAGCERRQRRVRDARAARRRAGAERGPDRERPAVDA